MLSKKYVVLAPILYGSDRRYIKRSLGDIIHVNSPDIVGWNRVDLVYLPGGADVDPKRYGGNDRLCGEPSPIMEKFDTTLLPTALDLGIPVMGVCRGAQSLWVELGGKLIEDLPDHPTNRVGVANQYLHPARGLWSSGVEFVNSLHHQAADPMHQPNGSIIGLIADDGVVEAFSYGDRVVAVQFHPELLMFDCESLLRAAVNRTADKILDPIDYDPNIYQHLASQL